MCGGVLGSSLLQSTSFFSGAPGKGSQPRLPDSAELWFPQKSLEGVWGAGLCLDLPSQCPPQGPI